MKKLEKFSRRVVCTLLACALAGSLGAYAYTPILDATNWDASIATDFADGNGTEYNPFIIENRAQLAYLAERVNHGDNYFGNYFSLAADIDLDNHDWIPIGDDRIHPFSGKFNGNGHRISNASQHSGDYAGLFGHLEGATIMNLGVTDFLVNYSRGERGIAAGIIAAAANDSTILNCYASNYYICGAQTVGGIVGTARMTVIENCYSNGRIQNTNRYSKITGGIAGSCYKGSTIKNCYSAGTVEGDTDYTTN